MNIHANVIVALRDLFCMMAQVVKEPALVTVAKFIRCVHDVGRVIVFDAARYY